MGIEHGILMFASGPSVGSSLPPHNPHAGIPAPCLGCKVSRTLLSLSIIHKGALFGDRLSLYHKLL